MRTTPHTRWLCCIPAEGAVTALGYFQASVAVMGILVALRNFVMDLHYILSRSYQNSSPELSYYVLEIIKLFSWQLLLVGTILALAMFLLVGLSKRRPGFVLTYFVISLLVALALASFMLYCIINYRQYTYEDGFIEISLALLVYFPCLAIVLLVYRDMAAESSNKIYNELQKNNYYDHEVMKKAVV